MKATAILTYFILSEFTEKSIGKELLELLVRDGEVIIKKFPGKYFS